ncbi:uncharacterized protein RB166_019018 [Leptodactylus fuscus]
MDMGSRLSNARPNNARPRPSSARPRANNVNKDNKQVMEDMVDMEDKVSNAKPDNRVRVDTMEVTKDIMVDRVCPNVIINTEVDIKVTSLERGTEEKNEHLLRKPS